MVLEPVSVYQIGKREEETNAIEIIEMGHGWSRSPRRVNFEKCAYWGVQLMWLLEGTMFSPNRRFSREILEISLKTIKKSKENLECITGTTQIDGGVEVIVTPEKIIQPSQVIPVQLLPKKDTVIRPISSQSDFYIFWKMIKEPQRERHRFISSVIKSDQKQLKE